MYTVRRAQTLNRNKQYIYIYIYNVNLRDLRRFRRGVVETLIILGL